jgi:hypothetical protein
VIVQNLTQLGGRADVLHTFIWGRVSGLMRFCDGSGKGTASNFVQISEKCDRTFGEESMSCTQMFEWNAWFMADQKKKARPLKGKSRRCSSFPLTPSHFTATV